MGISPFSKIIVLRQVDFLEFFIYIKATFNL